jgi:alcohol dehydrogenase/L-iditol 2-dehydrogenase
MNMKALVNYAPGKVEIREVQKPAPKKGEVLLKVKAVGVCGSDIHQWKGPVSYPVDYPIIIGHEFSGIIEEVGEGVEQWEPGQRVTSETSAVVCGRCEYCRTGDYHMCPDRKGFGALINGAMAEYVAVREGILHAIPDDLSFEEASLVEPASVAFNAILTNSSLTPGDTVVVIGPGPIGMMSLQIARLCSPANLILCGLEKDVQRMKKGAICGADYSIFTDKDDPKELIANLGDGLGAHMVVDTVGSSSTQKQAYSWTRPGGTVVKIGWDSRPLDISLDPIIAGSKRIQGTFSHNWPIWERVIALGAQEKINLKSIAEIFSSENWEQGFESMYELNVIKSVITW